MIKTTISISPFGNDSNSFSVGHLWIANIGRSSSNYNLYDYAYMLYEPKSHLHDEVFKHGILTGWDRYQTASKLIARCVDDDGDSGNDRSLDLANVWLKELLECN